jgi:hypothetical protein
MTGLFTKSIVSGGMNGKLNPTKNQNRQKDLSSFDNNLEICSGNLNFEFKAFLNSLIKHRCS